MSGYPVRSPDGRENPIKSMGELYATCKCRGSQLNEVNEAEAMRIGYHRTDRETREPISSRS